MARRRPVPRDLFPFENIDLGKTAILFDKYKDVWRPWRVHWRLPFARPDSKHVVIVVDGLGSSSAGLYLGDVLDCLEDIGFDICVFSYGGLTTHLYQPQDTVLSKLDDLVKHLDDYFDYYSDADCIWLLGYSFGGIVISEWLYRKGAQIGDLKAFRGSCLVASPIRVRQTRITYKREYPQIAAGREHVGRILTGYTAIPEHVPLIASMFHFRCKRDQLLDESAYTFQDLPVQDRPIEVVLPYAHHTIPLQDELIELVLQAALLLCPDVKPQDES